MCVECLRSQVDITEGLTKQATVLWCKECGRYLQPPKHWLRADPESKELLTYCLKKIKGLQKVKLVDAGFIWTEPHSRRLKLRVTVQAEVLNGTLLQQTFIVEYIIHTHMCPDCQRRNTNPNVWVAVVQVRQHIGHKRTFFYLEQLILKHNADVNCHSIKNMHEGVDFHFSSRANAQKFVDFLQNAVPMRSRHDKQLVSHNIHTTSYNYRYTFSVELVPICKDDLVCLPGKLASAFGSSIPLALCSRVTGVLCLTDPFSLRSINIDSTTYWRHPFKPLLHSRLLEEFAILDTEDCGISSKKFALAEVQVAKFTDLGTNDRLHTVKSHLGHLLKPGDTALGYDLTTAQLTDPELDRILSKGIGLPDIVLVRKSYEEKREAQRAHGHRRPWTLKKMVQNVDNESIGKARARGDAETLTMREDMDRERFLEELEEDPDLRSKISLYKRPGLAMDTVIADMDSDEENLPGVPLEELLEDLTAMQLSDSEMTGSE